jgi:hypothetical protein
LQDLDPAEAAIRLCGGLRAQKLRENARLLWVDLDAVALEKIDLIVSSGSPRPTRCCGQEVDLLKLLLPPTESW